VPFGVTTSTVPVLAPAGTTVAIAVTFPGLEDTPKTAGTPLKLMLLAPVRSVPES
jgi:hypothetical protein